MMTSCKGFTLMKIWQDVDRRWRIDIGPVVAAIACSALSDLVYLIVVHFFG